MLLTRTGLLMIAAFLIFPHPTPADPPTDVSPQNAYEKLTGEDMEEYEERWDRYFSTDGYVYGITPAPFLKKYIRLLPKGKVLDIAMGEGRNAVFMAAHGFTVEGVDISQVALAKANRLAKKRKVKIRTIHAGLQNYTIPPNSYDVILNIDFLMLSLVPKIKTGLKKGGMVIFESFTNDPSHPSAKTIRADWTLKKGELKKLFSDFEILAFEEIHDEKGSKEAIVARKK